MILISVSDSLQVVNNSIGFMDIFKTITLVGGAILVPFSIYWTIFQIRQGRKSKREKELKDKIEKVKHIEDIKPILRFGSAFRDFGNNLEGMHRNNGSIHIDVKNIGGNVKILSIIDLDDNSMKSNIRNHLGKMIEKNEEFVLSFEPISKDKRIHECMCHFKITFEDIEKNKYSQIAEGRYIGSITFSKPIEVTTM